MGINIAGWLFTFIVSCLLIVWVQVLWSEVGLLLTGTKANGVVVAVLDEGDVSKIVVEFTTSKGEKITYQSTNGNAIASAKVGTVVRVAYKASNPHYARVMLWSESSLFLIVGIFWFVFIFTYIWLGLIKITGDEAMGDPLHLLPKAVWLFPFITIRTTAYILLAFGLFGFGLTGYVFKNKADELRSNGIRVKGVVTGFNSKDNATNGRSFSSIDYALINYTDSLGASYTISRPILIPVSNINIGDTREIIYLPGEPHKGIVNSWWSLQFPTFFFSAIVVLLISLMVMLYNRPELWPPYTEKELMELHKDWKSKNLIGQ